MNAMLSMPDAINEDTGEAIVNDDALSKTFDQVTDLSGYIPNADLDVSYADWIETCSETENANQCTGDDDTQLTYGYYNAAKVANGMLDTSAEDLSTSSEEAFVMGSNDTVATTDSQAAPSSFNIVSLVQDSLRSYGKSLFASAPMPLTNVLTGFTLWR